MSDEAGSSSNGSSSNRAPPAAGSIGSLHTHTTPAGRLPSLRGGRGGATASTRGGATKLKFAPTVPTKRNKKDASLSLLEEAKASSSESGAFRGRGERGRGGRGRGRGGRFEDAVATASGPFSLGPAAAARSRAVAVGGGASGAHSSYTGVKALKVESGEGMSGEDRDFYGDAAVDLKFGSVATDASVPTGLDSVDTKDSKMKEQDMDKKFKKDEIKTFEGTEEDRADEEDEDVKIKMEGPAGDLLPSWVEDQMYFFQFPSVMPAFKPRPVTAVPMSSVSSSSASSPGASTASGDTDDSLMEVKPEPMDVDRPILIPDNDLLSVKAEPQDTRLGALSGAGSSAPDGQRARSKAVGGAAKQAEKNEVEESHLQQEGKIGRLLIYKSGKVKMKVGDIVMDVSSGSECSFLQDVVVVDSNNKQAFVMGSVQKRMVCVPNLTQLLNGLEASDV
ncbi:DNA-directed RNA polymerase III subunit RPC4 [Entomortierella parvispora]|uniref:DNA-directed RNA polymerase III subunit RPC4 n=1 Tax=Entomortierella parvispora TaxID=205924 RepID=A0A9P3HK68_9FUNG|nr:DNA-directed RNA polymerase III subunit RPC4 [Entomortierella parvispora]